MEHFVKEIRFGDLCGGPNEMLISCSFDPTRCLNVETTIYLYDSFGDGWDDVTMTITDPDGNVVFESDFTDGQEETHTIFLDGGFHDVEVTSGIHDSEITWIIYRGSKEDGDIILTGEAPFEGQFDPCRTSDTYTPPENEYIAQGFDYDNNIDEFTITDIWLERANQDGMPLHTHRMSQYENETLKVENDSQIKGSVFREGVMSNGNFVLISWNTSSMEDLQLVEVDKAGSIVQAPDIGDGSEIHLYGIQPAENGLIYVMFGLETENIGDTHDRMDIYDNNLNLVRSDHYEYDESELPSSYGSPEFMVGDDGYFVYNRSKELSYFTDSGGSISWQGLDRGPIPEGTWLNITGLLYSYTGKANNYIRDGRILVVFTKVQANVFALINTSTGVVEEYVEDASNTYVIVDGGNAIVTSNQTKYSTSDLSEIDDIHGGGLQPIHLMDNIYITGTTTSSMFTNEAGGGISREYDNNLDSGVMIFEPV